jgi:hypothetical protein
MLLEYDFASAGKDFFEREMGAWKPGTDFLHDGPKLCTSAHVYRHLPVSPSRFELLSG